MRIKGIYTGELNPSISITAAEEVGVDLGQLQRLRKASQANAEPNDSDYGGNDTTSDESKTISDRIRGGESEPETVEEI